MVRYNNWFYWGFTSLLVWSISGGSALAQALESAAATADVSTANCSGAACQASGDNGGAGPNPANITATVSLCQGNGVLTGVGVGENFQFGKTYISLIYKNGNVGTCSRFPDELDALLVNMADPRVDSDFASMMLGIWRVTPDGKGTLIVSKQAPVSGLQNYKTVSVREMQPPQLQYKADRDPAPQLNALRACGSLRTGVCTTDVCASLCANNPKVCQILTQYTGLCYPLPPLPP